MRSFWTVLTTELLRRRMTFWVALGAGFLPLGVLLLLDLPAAEVPEARAVIAASLAAGISLLLSFLLGLSLLGADQSDGRLTFWLARPIPAFALWSSRLAASLVLVFGSAALTLAPSLLVAGGPGQLIRQLQTLPRLSGATVLGVVLLLMGLGHLVRVMASDRSPWLAADLVSLACLATLAGLLLQSEIRFSGSRSLGTVEGGSDAGIPWALVFVVAALLAGSALHWVQGRWELRRGHRFMATTLVALLLPFTAWQAYGSLHPPAPSLDQLTTVDFAGPSPDQRWLALLGPDAEDPRLDLLFLTTPEPGTALPLGKGALSPLLFSADSSLAAWQNWSGYGSEVYTLNLRQPLPEPQLLGRFSQGPKEGFDLALSPRGTRMALLRDQTIEVIDLERRRSFGEYEGLPHDNRFAFFPDEDHLRIYIGDTGRSRPVEGIEILDLDLGTGKLERLGSLPEVRFRRQLVVSPDGSRLLARNAAKQVALRDGRTGERVASLEPAGGEPAGSDPDEYFATSWGWFLADGRAVVHRSLENSEVLELYAADGRSLRRIETPKATALIFQSEWAPGRVLLRSRLHGSKAGLWHLSEVNFATGAVRSLGDDLRLNAKPWMTYGSQSGFLATERSEAEGFFLLRGQDSVAWLNPDTGRSVVLWTGSP